MDVTWGVSVAEEVYWGWLIATYLFLAGLAAGAFLTSALTDLFKQSSKTVIRSGAYIAPVAIMLGLGLLVVDLERPLDFWKLFIYVDFTSIMSLGVFIVSLFTALAVAYAFLLWLDGRVPRQAQQNVAEQETAVAAAHQGIQVLRKPIAVLGGLLALATATYTGFLLSAVTTNELWAVTPFFGVDGPFLAFLFLVSSLSAGSAAALLGAVKAPDLAIYKKIDIFLITLEIVLLGVLYLSVEPSFFTGILGKFFVLGVLVIGLLLPLCLSLYGVYGHKNLVFPVATLVLVGGFCLRYFIIYSGQALG